MVEYKTFASTFCIYDKDDQIKFTVFVSIMGFLVFISQIYMFKITGEKIMKIKRPSGDPWDRTYCILSLDILRFYRIQLAISIFRVFISFALAAIWTNYTYFDRMLPM